MRGPGVGLVAIVKLPALRAGHGRATARSSREYGRTGPRRPPSVDACVDALPRDAVDLRQPRGKDWVQGAKWGANGVPGFCASGTAGRPTTEVTFGPQRGAEGR